MRGSIADLCAYLENAGFEPVLSEYGTFPVDPDSATVESCRKAVESKADIFVLVIGTRYGSTNEQDKSITNLEYTTARDKGIPIYVFVMRSIIDILPIWVANPSGDFKTVVDSPGLFEFVSAIRSSGETWVFSFDLAQDIVAVLRAQLSYLFTDSLELRIRASRSGVLTEKYKSVSGNELRLIIDRPRAWEYRLFSESLLREIAVSADLKRDWSSNLVLGPLRSVNLGELANYTHRKLAELIKLHKHLKYLFEEGLRAACGPTGQGGNPDTIIYVANRIGGVYRAALEWKLDFYRLLIEERLLTLRDLCVGLFDHLVVFCLSGCFSNTQ